MTTLETGGYKLAFINPVAGIDEVRDATPDEIKQIEAERKAQLLEKEKRSAITPTVEEKLASVGLSIDDLKAALGL
jgi:hypothetical protein